MLEYKHLPELDIHYQNYHILSVKNNLTITCNQNLLFDFQNRTSKIFFKIIGNIPTILLYYDRGGIYAVCLFNNKWTLLTDKYIYHDSENLYKIKSNQISTDCHVNVPTISLSKDIHIDGQCNIYRKNQIIGQLTGDYITSDETYIYFRIRSGHQNQGMKHLAIDKQTGQEIKDIVIPFVFSQLETDNHASWTSKYSIYNPDTNLYYSELKRWGKKIPIGSWHDAWWSNDKFIYYDSNCGSKNIFAPFSKQDAEYLASHEKSLLIYNLWIRKYGIFKQIPKLVWLYKIFPYTV